MNRDEAITTLKEMHDSFDEIHETTNGEIGYEQMTAIDMAIEALSAEAVQGWIPCSERLPSKNQEVLLQCHHNMIVGYWMDGDFDGEKEWRVLSGDGWESGCDFPNDVFEPLAWMPLPDPYTEMEP